MAVGFVRPAAAGQRLGNTCPEAARGREALTTALRFVVNHPLRNSTSRRWFALETLCQLRGVERVTDSGSCG